MRCREVGDGSHVDEQCPVLQPGSGVVDRETRKRGKVAVEPRTVLVVSGEAREVRGEGPESGEQLTDEGVFVGCLQKCVRGAFASDSCRAFRRSGSGTERAGAVGGVDGEVVGQREDLVAQRAVELSGQVFAGREAEEVGASDRADHERPAAEERDGFAVFAEEVGEVIGCMPGGWDRAQAQRIGECDLVARLDVVVGHSEPGTLRREELRAARGQLRSTRHVVGV